ncbi:hypothetical protein DEO72_LG1g2606 [Vigna unguiculata]|uniref:Uncharacterized protein n=1 Tax=Vigna unguiculata TaxID=3917 RepID=A0A4D6KUN0_VIGUN|nr:hypothetical protein DEO72_LG1g2605 [Vigna unguiculata]QCD78969.1 hypothetical protein DEO72_LG1g2606 [Vigna unguiculata]
MVDANWYRFVVVVLARVSGILSCVKLMTEAVGEDAFCSEGGARETAATAVEGHGGN